MHHYPTNDGSVCSVKGVAQLATNYIVCFGTETIIFYVR